MAMTLRLPPELDAAFQEIVERQHTSKQSVVIQLVENFVDANSKNSVLLESLRDAQDRYADGIKRLEDA